MALDNHYEGPPSLEIYQDFVQSAAIGDIDQNVVVVAPHYDVFKADTAQEDTDFKTYEAGKDLKLRYNTATKISDVDDNSVNPVFTEAVISQGDLSGTISENNGTIIKFAEDIDITNVKSSNMPMPVQVGDTIMVEYSTEGGTTNVITTDIKRITTDSDAITKDHTVTTIKGPDSVFTVTGEYTKKDTIYYIKVDEVTKPSNSSSSSSSSASGGSDSSLSSESTTDTAKVKLTISTVDGTDSAIIEMSYGSSVPFANSKLTLELAPDTQDKSLTAGDCYRVDVKSGKSTAKNVIHIGAEISGNSTNSVTVYFGKPYKFNVPEDQYTRNSDKTGVTVGAKLNIPSPFSMDYSSRVISGVVFLEYRAISRKFMNTIGYITYSDLSDVGYTGVENPLGAMVSVALKGGKGVYCLSVAEDSVAAYSKAFSLLSRSTTAYAVVIGSLRSDVIATADTFVTSMADPAVANYKILYYGLDSNNETIVMDTNKTRSNEEPWLATVSKGILEISNTVFTDNFYTKDVRPGDIIHIGYSVDTFGIEHFTAIEVKDVLDSDTLELVDEGYETVENMPFKFTVHRILEGSELVEELKKRVYTKNHRSYCVFGDGITVDGIANAPAWLLAALPAGMRAGEYCQRPISNLQYSGCTAENTMMLGSDDLRNLASRGVWILANTLDGTSVYNYHQLSTDMSDKKKQEQSYTTNFDNISREARALLSPYYGNSNISDDFLQQLNSDLQVFLSGKTTNAPSTEIGPQLIKYENLTLIQDSVNRDRVEMEVDYYMPAPFNHVKLRQRLM